MKKEDQTNETATKNGRADIAIIKELQTIPIMWQRAVIFKFLNKLYIFLTSNNFSKKQSHDLKTTSVTAQIKLLETHWSISKYLISYDTAIFGLHNCFDLKIPLQSVAKHLVISISILQKTMISYVLVLICR